VSLCVLTLETYLGDHPTIPTPLPPLTTFLHTCSPNSFISKTSSSFLPLLTYFFRMSRSTTASTPKKLPSKSAWARGPPQQNSANFTPHPQVPVPPNPVSATNLASSHSTHSRRPSTLDQGVSVKDGVSIPRNLVQQGIFLPTILVPSLIFTSPRIKCDLWLDR
jgi:hypothetical protein